jgi:hypothetical protein
VSHHLPPHHDDTSAASCVTTALAATSSHVMKTTPALPHDYEHRNRDCHVMTDDDSETTTAGHAHFTTRVPKPEDGYDEGWVRRRTKAQDTSNDVSWAFGMFFLSYSFNCFITNYYYTSLLPTTTTTEYGTITMAQQPATQPRHTITTTSQLRDNRVKGPRHVK